MDNLINLRDLLNHEILDLYSAEKQIIDALPKVIENATNDELADALSDHLAVTKNHKLRLEKVLELLGENDTDNLGKKEDGFFSKLFGGSSEVKCKGTEGLIKETEKMLEENMTPEVRDAAIIAGAQKIEHYEISGYGTAIAFAQQLGLEDVAEILEETLNEEYDADDLLTQLAVGKLNLEAENAIEDEEDNYEDQSEITSTLNYENSPLQNRSDEPLLSEIEEADKRVFKKYQ